MSRIWIPDGESCRVEWYLSQGRAVGVTEIVDHWIPHEVTPSKRAGFGQACDPPRDLPFNPLPARDEDRR